ncbi:hypothetical protein GCM10009114_33770 [Aliiglaciecola litoralis]|uniref:Uncharacterized protein n=1 Tax=Aliiglaciecola litoralis TaxID=582857 RepID=A0ABP3X2D7_9ALTE
MDRAGIFGGLERYNFSQMQRACEDLGIGIILAGSAPLKILKLVSGFNYVSIKAKKIQSAYQVST